MLELRIKASNRRYVAPERLKAEFGARRARYELGSMIEALMLQLDMIDGDPDLENDTSDFENSGDELGDPAYCEWDTLSAPTRRAEALNAKPIHPMHGMIHEDEEEDDAPEEDDPRESDGDDKDTSNAEDEVFAGQLWGVNGPGCELSDPPELAKAEGIYQGLGRPPWDHDDDEPRVVPNLWPAVRDAAFYRPPANLN